MNNKLVYFIELVCCIAIILCCIYGINNVILLLCYNGWIKEGISIEGLFNIVASVLSTFGTIFLGIIAIYQTKEANCISKDVLKKEILENGCFIQLKPKITFLIKHKEDAKVCMSAHHRWDNGATVAIEKNEKVEKYNEYYLRFYFINNSKNIIKKININSFLCVQDPMKDGGLNWDDNSNDPIPCSLDLCLGNNVQMNWIGLDEFFTHIKVYSPNDGIISSMFENKARTCIIFQYSIISVTNVQSKILFKIWIDKKKNGKIEAIYSNTVLLEEKILKTVVK